jgi:hypothetical protein
MSNGAMWHDDGFRGWQVSCPPGFLSKMLPGRLRQRFVTEIQVTAATRSD